MSRIVVRSVRPSHLHGFRPGQLQLNGLIEGVNVIWAPNAAGKSTLAKSIGFLLNPHDCDHHASVTGVLARDGVEEDRDVRRRDKVFPGFPGLAETYRLDLVSLLSGLSSKDQSELEKLVGSGLSIGSATMPSTRAPREVEEIRQALADLHEARRSKAQVANEEDRLPELRAAVVEAREADANLHALEALQSKSSFEAKLSRLLTELQGLKDKNPGVELQSPECLDTAKSLLRSIDAAKAAVAKSQSALNRLHSAPPYRPLSEVDELLLEKSLIEIKEARAVSASLSNRIAEAQATAAKGRDALLRLLPDEDPDLLPLPTNEDFDQLRSAIARADAQRVKKVESEVAGSLLRRWREDHQIAEQDLDVLSAKLSAWLAFEPAPPKDSRAMPLLAIAVATAALVAGLPELTFRIVGGLVGTLAAIYVALGTRSQATEQRPVLSGVPSELVPQPATVESVTRALGEIRRRKAEAEVENQLKALADVSVVEFNWQEISQNLRVKCDDPAILSSVATAAQTYLESIVALARHEADDEQARRRESDARRVVGEVFLKYEFPHEQGQEEETG
ncbi:MAG TPA: ATP-binding protein, partial [Fimbriimonas sp.]|nr:ATP-binding protein [Fimbriimonas sp.]